MRILLIGGGGREHALAWKLRQSTFCESLYVVPGNAGTDKIAINLPVTVTDFNAIAEAVVEYSIDMVIVGPEEPLVKGIWDFFKSKQELSHVQIIAPSEKAAMLEGSKAFAKEFMVRYDIPTASYKEFTVESFEEGKAYILEHSLPVVLKADGLAAGKGVVICNNTIEASAELEMMLLHSKFGKAGEKVVVEAYLKGIEMSLFVVTDGKNYVLLPEAKDYKRVGVGDTGLNTGGMGAVSPVPFFDAALKEKVINRIVEPTIKGLSEEGLDYTGFLFFGLMIVEGEPYVIEYNCRMGDPETEVVLPRLKSDLVEILKAAASGNLDKIHIETDEKSAAVIVAVSGGYPGVYKTGIPILGLDEKLPKSSIVFHAGTRKDGNAIVTAGGRVLAVTSLADSIEDAVEESTVTLELIEFQEMYFRKDIGYEFKKRVS